MGNSLSKVKGTLKAKSPKSKSTQRAKTTVEDIEALITPKPLTPLDAYDLTISQVNKGFHLTEYTNEIFEGFWTKITICPHCLTIYLGHLLNQYTIEHANGDPNALRSRLDRLFLAVHCLPPDLCYPSKPPVPLFGGTKGRYEPFIHEGKQYSLRASTEGSLWYGRQPQQGLKLCAVAVTMKEGYAEFGVPECLAYMSMIQSRRAVEKKKRHRIFGLCTDGEDFHFLEIDSGLNWSRLHLTYSNDLQQILELLAFIHLCASMLRDEDLDGESDDDSEAPVGYVIDPDYPAWVKA
ncbi:uncharacterized protein N7515_003888 [Penicillium bovifimosum]|uniref:Uncharacterized protein n=1 Tax=Penicillium bovifimosum TaxID=126998 RepID=A0A9W9H5I1_9EURO|nr:uncharacterized protein N7515_003888 [Penicillium bovifimosum]KAJ5139040.1 hypothetical protein N7515_003888 [Penicillium bovifimosum]